MEDTNKVTDNLELFYDVLDASNNYLYEITHENYFNLLKMTYKNIIAGEVLNDFEEDEINHLEEIYKPLEGIDFSVEDVRKALQSIILRCFKEMNISNGETTPDTLGLLIAYLISRFENGNKDKISIYDPFVGTGNLIFSIANHLENECVLYGTDNNQMKTELCKMTSDLMNTEITIYLQDTFNVELKNMNYITFDLPIIDLPSETDYMPYKAVLHMEKMLVPGGYIIAIIPNNFFDYDKDQKFKKALTKDMSIVGLIELPSSIFVSNPKSIIIIKNGTLEDKKCLMVKLPSFSDVKEFNNSLLQIETWFENNIKNKKI